MNNYIVTGGAGFIGSHLVDQLLADGQGVVVIDDFSTGRPANLASHQQQPNLWVIKRSVTDNLDDVFTQYQPAAVFHLAAIPSVQFSIQNPAQAHDVNVNGAINLLNNCRQFKVKRFVFASSSAIYGDQPQLPNVETMPANPLSPYALHKLVVEQYAKLFSNLYELQPVLLRFFNVYGPRQNPAGEYAGVISKFIDQLLRGQTPVIYGDGQQSRDFVYVADVVRALISAGNLKAGPAISQPINIGHGQSFSVNQITAELIKLSGAEVAPQHGPAVIEPRQTLADITKAQTWLGWQPQFSLADGLRLTWDYFKQNVAAGG